MKDRSASLEPHQARKRFGQHFLQDTMIIERIVSSLNLKRQDCLLEIGPGLGALTYRLLGRVDQLLAIEVDRDLAGQLRQNSPAYGTLRLTEGNALKVDYTLLAAGRPLRIVGNLPYNISTPLLFHLLHQAATIQDMTFMLQKEVVDRLTASPGSKNYGRLSVMAQYYCQTDWLFDVASDCFKPAPKVMSAVIRLLPRPFTEHCLQPHALAEVVTQAFGQRRKTLRNALKLLIPAEAMTAMGINPAARPEELSIGQYVHLSNWWVTHSSD